MFFLNILIGNPLENKNTAKAVTLKICKYGCTDLSKFLQAMIKISSEAKLLLDHQRVKPP